jgi:hypothetical protein
MEKLRNSLHYRPDIKNSATSLCVVYQEYFMPFLIGLVVAVIFGAFYYYVLYSPALQADWEKLSTLAEYLEKYPGSKTDDDEN